MIKYNRNFILNKKIIISTISIILLIHSIPSFSQLLPSNYFYSNSYYNMLPHNAAYAGQDSFSIAVSGFAETSYFQFKENEFETGYRGAQFNISTNLKKLHSAIGVVAEASGSGGDDIYFASIKEYVLGIVYNFNIKVNDKSNLRIGTRINKNKREASSSNFSTITIDPAIWYARERWSAGISLKNITNEENLSQEIEFDSWFKLLQKNDTKLVGVFNICHSISDNEVNEYRFIPQVNLETAKVLLFNLSYIRYIYDYKMKDHKDIIIVGAGIKCSPKVKLMLNYFGNDKYNKEISMMLKCDF
ncbi:MAG: type IX secretion system membrane protein PorP/SprF [Bacteroidota bacterium]